MNEYTRIFFSHDFLSFFFCVSLLIEVQGITLEPKGNGNSQGMKLISYKDKMLQINGSGGVSKDEGVDVWIECQTREEDEEINLDGEVTALDGDPLCPTYVYSKSQHKEDYKQWKNALIIKLIRKRISARFLAARLQRLWSLVGTYDLIDLDNCHLLFRFHNDEDYAHVLHEDPWIVLDHYVIIQRWHPLFDPYEDEVCKLAVWLRIPGLPLEFYSSSHLKRIGSIFGKTLKVDKNSLRNIDGESGEVTVRVKYARICVEVDLRKSFLSKFKIGDRTFNVGYEELHLICFSCVRCGHKKEHCSNQVMSLSTEEQHDPPQEPREGSNKEEVTKDSLEAFGSWRVVQKMGKGRRRRVVPVIETKTVAKGSMVSSQPSE
ncbi:uncharacterized protein LOC133296918 [Gastrolobium bilobum]|uniref:uncharacterized protein LOC133296918 n=1 Tax=Gastrolobium bilobum TaxID=150636 RepID=UPI002AAFFD5A|nr:uncharacterized protein LOC133296918 [Gastrolobium bilobum]